MSSTGEAHPHPLLIIGIDGATFDLVDPWAEAGYLPTLSGLMAEGFHGPLRVWPNMNSAAAWTSMVTGYNPGRHGIFDFGLPRPWTDWHWQPTIGASRGKEAMWKLASDGGDRVGVVNVPLSFPAEQLNGFMIAGMDAPSVRSEGFCHPPELADELRREGIDYVLDLPNLQVLSKRDPERGARLARRMVDVRAATLGHLMTTRPWDLLMGVFVVTDRLQHHYWPAEDESLDGPGWAAIRDIYVRIDSLIGELISRAGRPCNVIVVSDHGFGPARMASKGLNRVFADLGLLHFERKGADWSGRLLAQGLEAGRRLIPQGWQRSLARALPRLYNRAVHERKVADVDWERTRVYASANGGSVYLRSDDEETRRAGDSGGRKRLQAEVISLLESLVDPESKRPLIRSVKSREELYSGPFASHAGDLIIDWDHDVCRDSILYRKQDLEKTLKVDRVAGPGEHWRADHRAEGILIACGPDIRRGIRRSSSIYDVAPTVLYLRDQSLPSDLDGRVIEEMIDEDLFRTRPPRFDDRGPSSGRSESDSLSDDDKRRIEERLRSLGYIS